MSGLTLTRGDVLYDATIANQSTAADPSISVWASANAGAGKTKVLIDRIARLLLAGALPGRVLAVTYTKAAAAEMQTRLYAKLGDWTIASDGELRVELLRLDPNLDLEKPGTLSRARALFAAALETPGGLKIQTIHAFCTAILQRFPLEAGVPPGFQTLDDTTRAQLADQAFETAANANRDVFLKIAALTGQDGDRAVLEEALKNKKGLLAAGQCEIKLNKRLSRALGITSHDTPDNLRADAIAALDTGALTAAALALGEGADKDQKLSRLISNALQEADPELAWQDLLSTIQTGKGERQARQIYSKPKPKKENSIITAAFGPYEAWPSPFCLAIEAAEDQIRACELRDNSALLTEAALAYDAAWTHAKRSIGVLDFEDLIAATASLLKSGNGAAQWVLYKLDAGIEHILIDEAQDTNPEQWDLLAPLFEVLDTEARDQPRTRFVVGDEKQSIFSFQGARPERFINERARFEAGAADYNDGRKALSFDLSFRTGQTILDAVDATWALTSPLGTLPLAQSDEADPPFERKYAFETRHSAFRKQQIGAVELWPLMLNPEKAPNVKAHEQPFDVEHEASGRNALADRIAMDLKHRLDACFPVWDEGETRPMRAGDVMVLVKRRNAFFHQLIRRLKHHGVPVAGADRIKLVEDVGVQDLMALAQFALLPEDDFNTACVLKGAFCGLVDDDKQLFPLAYDRGSQSLWNRLCVSDDPQFAPARDFLQLVLNRAGHLPPYEFFAAILEQAMPESTRTGWQILIERLGREVREPVEAFLSRALDYGTTSAPTLNAFLNQIENEKADVKRELDQEGSGVRVMTVHGAKGLEAPIVILPDTTSSSTGSAQKTRETSVYFDAAAKAFLWSPDRARYSVAFGALRDQAENQTLQEDARLLYVAMTRARDVLIVCGHQHGGISEKEDGKSDGMAKQCWLRTLQRSIPLLGEATLIDRADFCIQMWGAYAPQSENIPHEQLLAPDHFPAWVHQPVIAETNLVRRIAPSALVPDGSEPPALSPLATGAKKRFQRGRLIHALLQRLPDLKPDQWEPAAAKRLLREADLDGATQAAIVRETIDVLRDPRFAAIFGAGSRAEAAIVGRGIGLPDDVVVNGSVDRLVVTDAQVLVLDFKTNRPPPETVEGVAQVYLNQMAAYRALLQARWPDKVVRCALLWTDGPRLMELPDAILDDALRNIAALPR